MNGIYLLCSSAASLFGNSKDAITPRANTPKTIIKLTFAGMCKPVLNTASEACNAILKRDGVADGHLEIINSGVPMGIGNLLRHTTLT